MSAEPTRPVKIIAAADDFGAPLKDALVAHLRSQAIEVEDLGTSSYHSAEPRSVAESPNPPTSAASSPAARAPASPSSPTNSPASTRPPASRHPTPSTPAPSTTPTCSPSPASTPRRKPQSRSWTLAEHAV